MVAPEPEPVAPSAVDVSPEPVAETIPAAESSAPAPVTPSPAAPVVSVAPVPPPAPVVPAPIVHKVGDLVGRIKLKRVSVTELRLSERGPVLVALGVVHSTPRSLAAS